MAARKEIEHLPLFAGIGRPELDAIAASFDEESFPAGATLIEEGRPNHTFYVLLEGEVAVSIGGAPRRTLGRGDFFGEISMEGRSQATATVRTAAPVTALVMGHEQFRALDGNPAISGRLTAAIAARR